MNLQEQLRRCELFIGLDEEALIALSHQVRALAVKGQETLFAQGADADGMYIVVHGRLRVIRTGPDDTEQALGEVGHGGYVGELALLLNAPRSATVKCIRDSVLLHLSRRGFDELVSRFPSAAMAIARTVAQRSDSHRSRTPMDRIRTVAVVPASPGAVTDFVVDEMARGFADHGTCAVLRLENLEPALRQITMQREVNQEQLAEHLTRVEYANDVVVYAAGRSSDVWTGCCLRQADVVLAVVNADDPPDSLAPVVQHLPTPVHLVTVRTPGQMPRGTDAWLTRWTFKAHHHIRNGNVDDIQRMTRVLGRRATGLALSGGGNRTTAFVGVVDALRERGIIIDVVAGTSGGALLGGMVALGMDRETMAENIRQLGGAPFHLDLGPPLVSLMGGSTWNRLLQSFFGDRDVSDTPLPFFAVSASLHHSHAVVPTTGPLWRVIQASTAFPGLFPPVPLNGDLLVDGGIINNLPADLLVPTCTDGAIIAADVSSAPAFAHVPEDLHVAGGWRLLWRRLSGDAPVPALIDILQQAACMASNAQLAATLRHVDLHLQPMLNGIPSGDDDTITAMIELGYATTHRALDAQERFRRDARLPGRSATTSA